MAFLTRLTQILSGKNLTPQTELEAAVKQAVANAGGGTAAGGSLVLHADTETKALDKTWQEIHDALESGRYVVYPFTSSGAGSESLDIDIITGTNVFEGAYSIFSMLVTDDAFADTDSADGYPILKS